MIKQHIEPMEKEGKKKKEEKQENKENIILKKIRYYQGSVKDFATFWEEKCKEGVSEESEETKSLKKKNDDLNKSFTIIPIEEEEE